jgi:transcriptional regulator with XRE-family HTH domain
MGLTVEALARMTFAERLVALRKERRLTQRALAQMIGVHLSQLRRYEAGTSQPTLETLRKLAVALQVSADALVFNQDERGPDDHLKLQFEAVSRLTPTEKDAARMLLEGLILRHDASRWTAPPPPPSAAPAERRRSKRRREPAIAGERR